MKKRRLSVEYTGGLDSDLDVKITKAIEDLGFKWYAQGTEIETRIRDIVFYEKVKEE